MTHKKIEEMTYDELIAFKNYADSQAADAKIKLAVARTEAVQEGFYLPAADYEEMLMIFGFALYGFLTAMFEVQDWLGRKYNDNPPYLVRIMHIIVIVVLILFMTRAME